MKKTLDRYDMIEGFSDYDEWSYCVIDKMWYEDAKEIVPLPDKACSDNDNFTCLMKVDYIAYFEDTWDSISEDNGFEDYINYLFGENTAGDVFYSAVCFKTDNCELCCSFSQYGIMGIGNFIQKIKKSEYAAEYIESLNAIKLFFRLTQDGKARFTVQSYNHEDEYLKILFDVITDRNAIIQELQRIIDEWRHTIYSAIKKQEIILKKDFINVRKDNAISYFLGEAF